MRARREPPEEQGKGGKSQVRRDFVPVLAVILLLEGAWATGLWIAHYLPVWRTPAAEAASMHAEVVRMRRAMRDPRKDPAVGRPMPTIRLVTEGGRNLASSAFSGRRTVLVFDAAEST